MQNFGFNNKYTIILTIGITVHKYLRQYIDFFPPCNQRDYSRTPNSLKLIRPPEIWSEYYRKMTTDAAKISAFEQLPLCNGNRNRISVF